eukprot:2083761-Pleurochrysis_carterae.AAC.3
MEQLREMLKRRGQRVRGARDRPARYELHAMIEQLQDVGSHIPSKVKQRLNGCWLLAGTFLEFQAGRLRAKLQMVRLDACSTGDWQAGRAGEAAAAHAGARGQHAECRGKPHFELRNSRYRDSGFAAEEQGGRGGGVAIRGPSLYWRGASGLHFSTCEQFWLSSQTCMRSRRAFTSKQKEWLQMQIHLTDHAAAVR